MKHIMQKEMESELMLYDTEADAIHVLNKTARRIYELSMNAASMDEIETCLRREFEGEPMGDIKQDIRLCLKELKQKGLLEAEIHD